ncbi:hypothetical protein Leryth_012404 [Lithospermum erythrorhizon]|nr:hypothetical protein Leryth_012404 [Lithospermum erythrorhizon]
MFLTLYTAEINLVSKFMDQAEKLFLSTTSATTAPSAVPSRHIQAVRESSAGYVWSVIAYAKKEGSDVPFVG